MKHIKCKWNCFGEMRDAELYGHEYHGGAKAIEVYVDSEYGMEPWSMATVNVPPHMPPDDAVFVKDYSENAGTVDNLVREGIISPEIVDTVSSGYVTVCAYRLTEKGMTLWEDGNGD